MYVMACLAERGQTLRTVLAVRGAARAADAHRVIAGALQPAVARALEPADLERVRAELLRLPDPGRRPRLRGSDVLGALAVFMVVVTSTLPVALPFLFVGEPARAVRLSNLVAVAMMFFAGLAYGRLAGYRPWVTGLSMVGLGTALVMLTIFLGG